MSVTLSPMASDHDPGMSPPASHDALPQMVPDFVEQAGIYHALRLYFLRNPLHIHVFAGH
jgi:hypothetical protein